MPGFNPQQLSYDVRSGNTSLLLIGDQPIAFAQTVTHSFDFGTETFYGVGSAKPQEIQQLRVQPRVTVDTLALTSQGAAIIQSGQTLVGLLANNSFNICIVDGVTNTATFTYVGSVAADFSESVPMNRPITDAITFLALDVLDASGVSILNGPNVLTV